MVEFKCNNLLINNLYKVMNYRYLTMKTKGFVFFRLIFVLMGFLATQVYAQELAFKVLESQNDWLEAKKQASETGKFLFLDIYAVWCGPCKLMDTEVYSDSAVGDYYNSKFINLKVDGESEFGRVLASKYQLKGYPSLYFISNEGELISVLVGFMESAAFIEAGRIIVESGEKYLELNSIYKKNLLTDGQTFEFMELLAKFGNNDELAVLAEKKIKSFSEADILNTANKTIVTAIITDIESFPVNLIMKNATALKTSWGQEDFSQYLSSVFDMTMQKAVGTNDSLLMERIASELVPVYMMDNPDRIPEAKLTTRKIYFSGTKDWANYIKTIENYYSDYEKANIRFLYSEAYYIVENQINSPEILNKSQEWVEKVIAVQPDFESYFLAAIISTYRDDNNAALLWMNKAGSVAVSGDDKASLEELKKYLEAQ